MIWVQPIVPHPGNVVTSLNKTLYDDYRCLVASNRHQIQYTRIKRKPQKHWITGNYLSEADSSYHEAAIAMKSVRIVQ